MLYLEWYDVKLIEKSWSFQKQCVFPLFSEKKKKHLQKLCKCLIINVDQPELIHDMSLSLLAKYLPFCTDSLCSRNVAAN